MRVEPTVPANVLAAIRAPLEGLSSPERYEAPLLQPLNLALELAGEETRSQLFVVQAEGGQELCLRPDFTIGIVQRHIEAGWIAGNYFYEGPAFRASPGSDAPEQFLQQGLEQIAAPGIGLHNDSESAGVAWRAALAGGREDLTLWIGDVRLFAAFIGSLGLPEALAARLQRLAGRPGLLNAELHHAEQPRAGPGAGALADMLARLSEHDAERLVEEVWSLAGVPRVGGRTAADVAARLSRRAAAEDAPRLTEGQAASIRAFMALADEPENCFAAIRELATASPRLDLAVSEGEAVVGNLIYRGVPKDRIRFAPALGHAFDYYDGVVFEVRSEALGEHRPVAVGGRYDGLLARLGGRRDALAVGCMVRPWRAWSEGER